MNCNNVYSSADNKHFILCPLSYRNQIITFIGINKILHNKDGNRQWLHTIMYVCLPEVEKRVSQNKELGQFSFDGY